MDTNTISRIISEAISTIPYEKLEISVNENDVIFIEIISNSFVGERLLKRISRLSDLCLKVSMNELQDYTLSFIPLTENEKKLEISETQGEFTGDTSSDKISAKSRDALY